MFGELLVLLVFLLLGASILDKWIGIDTALGALAELFKQ